MRAAVIALLLVGSIAHADEDPCARGRFHGPRMDVDLKAADLANAFRLFAAVGGVSVVIPDDVTGQLTMRLHHVPWEKAMCVAAKLQHLEIHLDEGIYYVQRASRPE